MHADLCDVFFKYKIKQHYHINSLNWLLFVAAGALVVERSADVEEGFSETAPLVYHYGHNSPSDNLTLYHMLITCMADVINVRCEQNKKGKNKIYLYMYAA